MTSSVRTKKRPAKSNKTASWADAIDRFMNSLEHAARSGHTTHHYRDDLRAFATWWKEDDSREGPHAASNYRVRLP